MRPEEYYRAQLALECKRLLPSGRLTEVPCANPDGLALISVVRFRDGSGAIHLRYDAGDEVERLTGSLKVDDLLSAHRSSAVLTRRSAVRTGIITESPPRTDVIVTTDGGRFEVREGERVVASAFSAREDASAAELSVETDENRRRRGYGKAVATAWASSILDSGRIAFYSYDFTNRASEALANALGVRLQFDTGSFELAV